MTKVSDSHWAILAGTRFFLASIVMNAHCGLAVPPGALFPPTWSPDLPYSMVYMIGRKLGPLAAILGFLIISGFSIGHSFQRPSGFYGRRVGRIFPSLLVAVVFYVACLAVWAPIKTTSGATAYMPGPVHIAGTLVGLNGFLFGSFLGPTWSLSAELAYYWLTPLFSRMRAWHLLVLVAASGWLYWHNESLNIGPYPGVLYGLTAMSLFWAWGIGFLYARFPAPWSALLLGSPGILLLAQFNYEGGINSGITFFAAAAAIGAGDQLRLPSFIRSILNYLGDLSYPLYLVHYPIIIVMNGVFGVRSQFALVGISLLASAICLHGVERPLRPLIARAWLRLPGAAGHGVKSARPA